MALKVIGTVRRVVGPVVEVAGAREAQMLELVEVGREHLVGEVVRVQGDVATAQVYEDTTGLTPGEAVYGSGLPLSVELGPGIMGSIFETVSAMIITLPVVFPLIVGLGFDPIWWGVINIMVIEIGQTTPPIGIIPFVLHGMRPDIPLKTIFGGVLPFFIADLTRLAIIAAFPILALWLPDLLGMLVTY